MCGILALLGPTTLDENSLKKLESLINARGPDYQSPILDHGTNCAIELKLKASVLHLRGRTMQKQPVIDEHSNALMFNGHIYEFSGSPIDWMSSDTQFLADKLKDCKTRDEILDNISSIRGPFAFVYWCSSLNTLFYGRDMLGRRSLNALVDENLNPQIISSVAIQSMVHEEKNRNLTWKEIDCSGIYSMRFGSGKILERTRYTWDIASIFPYSKSDPEIVTDDMSMYPLLARNSIIPLNEDLRLPEEFNDEQRELAIEKLEAVLTESISKRLDYNVNRCLKCRQTVGSKVNKSCSHSKVAVAYSGGVDSALLAIMLDKILDKEETIDLINVAFKPRSPDRLTATIGFKELRRLSPSRNWRLVLCDITPTRLQTERSTTIRHLISPCDTVIDDSLGCACWFISEAKGRALDSTLNDEQFNEQFPIFLEYNTSTNLDVSTDVEVNQTYTSPATILFAGMGIDEQLGGYSSHRSAWSSFKIQGLLEEISSQMRRIPTRNLGRDDRILAHHARDVKLPYLDYNVISYINSLPVGLKMNLNEPLELGPKKLLRQLASRLGLRESSKQVKRALQFGTRIAHLENSKEKGNQSCARLT